MRVGVIGLFGYFCASVMRNFLIFDLDSLDNSLWTTSLDYKLDKLVDRKEGVSVPYKSCFYLNSLSQPFAGQLGYANRLFS